MDRSTGSLVVTTFLEQRLSAEIVWHDRAAELDIWVA